MNFEFPLFSYNGPFALLSVPLYQTCAFVLNVTCALWDKNALGTKNALGSKSAFYAKSALYTKFAHGTKLYFGPKLGYLIRGSGL